MINKKKLKKNINNDIKNLGNLISLKISRIDYITKKNRGRDSVERSKKELFVYGSSEELLKVKKKQLKNMTKFDSIVDNDISKINYNLKKGYYINQELKEENPSIKTKTDELNFVISKLNTDIGVIKNEIQVLKNIKRMHDNHCEKKLSKLEKELEILQERKNRNLIYEDMIGQKKEAKELRRKQIEQDRAGKNQNKLGQNNSFNSKRKKKKYRKFKKE